ncbi:MAG: DUF1854 domain-containing protein, partial [Verrucomicrobiales bacterium]
MLLAYSCLAPPYFTGVLIDEIIGPFQAGGGEADAPRRAAAWILVIISGAFLLRFALQWVRLHVMAILGEDVAHDMRRDVYGAVQRLGVPFFSRTSTGGVVSRVSSDTDRIWEFVAFGVVEVSLSLVTLLGVAIVLLVLDWRLGLAMVLPVPLMVWAILANARNMQGHYTRAWRKWAELNEVITDTIPGIRIVKAFVQERRENERFGKRNREMRETFNRVHASWTRFWPLLMLGIQAISIAVYWLALPRLFSEVSSPAHLTLGTLVTFLLFMGMFFQPIESFGQMSRMLTRALSSAQRVFDLIDAAPAPAEAQPGAGGAGQAQKPEDRERWRGAVEFRDVCFGYEAARPVLRGVSFAVGAGETVGVVGASGAGKTTLANLLVKFYQVERGAILVDGREIETLESAALRRRIGLVEQNPSLFQSSVLENLRYGKPDAERSEVISAARLVAGHAFILEMPQAYDTVVGERGHTVSAGERQRIALARALLTDPSILILDEAMSNIDVETDRAIRKSLAPLFAERTVLVIAHRLSTLEEVDRILVLAEGIIAEEGTPEQLLAKENGIYRRMAQRDDAGEKKRPGDAPEDSGEAALCGSFSLRLAADSGGLEMLASGGGGEARWVAVRARPCFPLSAPGRSISLVAVEGGGELALVDSLDELDPDSRAVLEGELAARAFAIEITAIEAIRSGPALREWEVRTRQGPGTRRFLTALDAWPRTLP